MINVGSDSPVAKVNEICEVLEPLALQVIEKVESNNVLNEIFEKEKVTNGAEVEYLLINGANVENYDPEGKTTLKPRELKKAVQYFNDYGHKVFVNSIYASEIEDIAMSEEKANEIVGTIINQIAVERDDYDYAKELSILQEIKETYPSLSIGEIEGNTITEKCEDLTEKLRNTIDAFLFKNGKFLAYNLTHDNKIKTKTRFENIRIIMPYNLRNKIDVKFLASVYNLEKADLLSKITTIDTEDNIIYVIDKKSTFKYPKYNQLILEQYNAEGNFRSVFLHQKAMFGFCGLYKFAFIDCTSMVNPEPVPPVIEKCELTIQLNTRNIPFNMTLANSETSEVVESVGVDVANGWAKYLVDAGSYEINVLAENMQEYTDLITISDEDVGSEKTINITLVEDYKTIIIEVTNEGIESSIAVYDSEMNVVDPVGAMTGQASYNLQVGTYTYSVSASGYTTDSNTISILESDYGQTDTITITLVEE